MNRHRSVVRDVLLGLLVVVLVGGCSTTLKDVPIPGTGVSGDTITLKVDFEEALNLAEGATVKVNGVDSGKVQGVAAKDFAAQATMLVRKDAEMREGATARLRYGTPLGELFIDITNPSTGPELADGAVLGLRQSSTAPTVEDALSQASLLINGGGLAQLQTVTDELNTVVGGRESTVRSMLDRTRVFLTETNATTGDIDLALRSLSSLATTLQAREQTINRALREIRPAARVLRRNTPGLTRLLAEVENFSVIANDTVGKTRRQLLSIARQAGPVLAEFVRNRDRYPLSLTQLISLGDVVDNVVPGDYASISLDLHLDGLSLPELADLLDILGQPLPDLPLPDLPLPDLPLDALPGLLGNVGANSALPLTGPDPLTLSGMLGGVP